MKKTIPFLILLLVFSQFGFAQILGEGTKYTKADTLRGSLRPERNYDVLKYHIKLKVEPEKKYISGSNTITFKVPENLPVMQVDLFKNMQVDSIIYHQEPQEFTRKFNAVFIEFEEPIPGNITDSIQFYYSGNPVVAKNAPWDGGLVWSEDKNGNPWIATAVQGTGASLWYPNKDHQSDEPEEALIEVAVPNGLMNVSNGRLVGKKDLENGYTLWSWKVTNPINNYGISLNIADYAHFSDSYKNLDLNYYVLPYNLEKAKEQFEEVKAMMECFYKKLGPYPFVEDGYKLVETPFLGMEHQSAVAYGNQYKNGYLGRDLSGTGIGLKWDFIIIHESAHEWFGNSITAADIADMWIHEGFTTYAESVYIECRWGKEKALEYLQGIRKNILNETTIIGDYGVNSSGSGDMYYKGANLLNTIRSIYNNDELWWDTMRDYVKTYKHEIINTQITEDFFDAATPVNLEPVFDQYLRHADLPQLQFKKENGKLLYRWEADVENFTMPIDIFINGTEKRIFPTEKWQELTKENIDLDEVKVIEKEFYVDTKYM
ncbi:MAG TPA: M1 family metallopeptidase [Salinimicrobium sp.]|nr:M1 family metallopeptidase [Salinimicrobium sp.]